jgi:hypothetical protein
MTKNNKLEKTGFVLVFLMVLLQSFYALFAIINPQAFAVVRGTELFAVMDADWVVIYGSRTLFISLILAYLLYAKHYAILMWGALFGMVMPIIDGYLAYEAQASAKVIGKHIATVIYLMITSFILRKIVVSKSQ